MQLRRVVALVAIATTAVGLPTFALLRHSSGRAVNAATSTTLPNTLAAVAPAGALPTLIPTVPGVLGHPTPTPSAKPPQPGPPQPLGRTDLVSYRGLGTWVDAFDYSRELGGTAPPSSVDTMAQEGVRTLYIQAAKESPKTPNALTSPDLLGQYLTRAHAHHMRVVAWYLPTFTDPNRDWVHIDAIVKFRVNGERFDSIGLDIESRDVSDVNTRNSRLIALSKRVRAEVGNAMALSAIVLPPVVTDKINTAYWPNFPWHAIASSYDVWLPMAYWTNRKPSSGYRDAYRYVHDNVSLLRGDLGQANAPVHVVGGIGDAATNADYQGMIKAAKAAHAIGDSIYDWGVTAANSYPTLRTSPA